MIAKEPVGAQRGLGQHQQSRVSSISALRALPGILWRAACLLGFALAMVQRLSAQTQPWMNTALPAEQRAGLLLAQMTLDEKIAMVHGCAGQYVGNVTNNSRLGIPGLHLSDGPAGVSDGMQGVTALPAPIALAASWDTGLAREYGAVAGAEARGKGVHVLLGPMMNMVRVPQGGRSFETFSEDPFLAAALAAAHVQGVQSQGVIANAKHFVCNDQESNRGDENSQVDERTLQEIYYPPFLASVRAGVGSVCAAYNQVNGSWASESPLLNSVLKTMWGFGGWVECDWGANFSTDGAATNGLDMEMPYPLRYGTNLEADILSGAVPAPALDGMVRRILTSMFRFGIFDNPTSGTWGATVTSDAHTQFARDAATQGIVLLKNAGNLLPLATASIHSIAVIGSVAAASPIWTGTGSGQVYMPYYNTPLDAISNRVGTNIITAYAQGDGSGADTNAAVQLARQSDVAIVCVGQQTGEGNDRTNLALPEGQDALVSAVAAANSNTIVVLYVDAGTLMPWAGQVPAALVAWYPGQEGANALASILFGDSNPSAKLPVSFPAAASQVPANTAAQYPGTNNQVIYSEGLLVGYRWYDASNIPPQFPFGLGLSYTTFAYSNLTVGAVSPSGQVQVSFVLSNTGGHAGAEVAQLYLGFPAVAAEPPKQLKGFQKALLQPGQTQQVIFNLDWQDLAFWDVSSQSWKVPLGRFQVMVGASSRDIWLTNSFAVSSPVPSSGVANLAFLETVIVSSSLATNFPGAAAVDGDSATRWASLSGDPQWITVDLGATKPINRIRLNWYTNYASSYQIRLSDDDTNWSSSYSTTSGAGGLEDVVLTGSGRYVQLYATHSATASGYSLQELEVYSPAGQTAPPDTNPPVVFIIAPTNNSLVSGSVALLASATDDVSVATVQFQLDGLNLGVLETIPPYGFVWDTTANTNGLHQLTAVAVDTSGNQATSSVIKLTITNSISPAPTNTIWVDDALPRGAIPGADGGDSWDDWVSNNPAPYSGALASQSNIADGEHQHFFAWTPANLVVNTGGVLFAYAYLNPSNPPSELMLQWFDSSWEHRAYWGADNISFGISGTTSRYYAGPLPPLGQWTKLSVPASLVGLEGSALNGMSFALFGGQATWDYAGGSSAWISNSIPPPVQHLAGAFTNAMAQFQLDTVGNWLYTLERSTNLHSWAAVSTPTLATATNMLLQDTNPPAIRGFYRVRTSSP